MSSGAGAGGSIAQMLKTAAEDATTQRDGLPVFSDAAIRE